MPEPTPDLFRKKSLERLASPEKLEQLMKVVRPKDWLVSASLTVLLSAAAAWSVFGRIPVTIQGQGVATYPQNIIPFQATGAGRIAKLEVEVGDRVRKGDLLATLDQIELCQQLLLAKVQQKELQRQDNQISALQGVGAIQAKQALQAQRASLQQRLAAAQELMPILEQRQDVRRSLRQEGAVSVDIVLEAQQEYLSNMSSISEVQSSLEEVNTQEIELDRQNVQSSVARKNEIQQITQKIEQLELQLQESMQVVSPYDGTVLELAVTPGVVIQPGTRLGNIAADTASEQLIAVTFFPVGEGKKVKPGMMIQVTPQTVERERFGGILGKVTNVSAYPVTREAAANIVGNKELIEDLIPNTNSLIVVFAELTPSSRTESGYEWSSSQGPPIQLSPGTTTVSQVMVEERAPITFVLPILREWTGVD